MEIKVLCVDEEGIIMDLFSRDFKESGLTFETANSAAEALEMLDEKKFDAAVIDMFFSGTNAIELGKKIRTRNSSIFLTAITDHPNKFELSDCRKAGFDAYFAKPLDIAQLGGAIRDAWEK